MIAWTQLHFFSVKSRNWNFIQGMTRIFSFRIFDFYIKIWFLIMSKSMNMGQEWLNMCWNIPKELKLIFFIQGIQCIFKKDNVNWWDVLLCSWGLLIVVWSNLKIKNDLSPLLKDRNQQWIKNIWCWKHYFIA